MVHELANILIRAGMGEQFERSFSAAVPLFKRAKGCESVHLERSVEDPLRYIMGIVRGDVVAKTFIPVLIDLYKQGRFPFDRLVRFYAFDDINQAMEDSERGVTIKPILRVAREPVAA